jgi:hypothetical protein
MQISIDTETLERLATYAAMAIGRAGDIAIDASDVLTTSVNEIGRTLAGLLDRPYVPPETKEPQDEPASKYDELRIAIGRVDALASAVEDLFDNTLWGGEIDHRRLERCAHLVGLTRQSAEAAVIAVDRLDSDLVTTEIPAGVPTQPGDWEAP